MSQQARTTTTLPQSNRQENIQKEQAITVRVAAKPLLYFAVIDCLGLVFVALAYTLTRRNDVNGGTLLFWLTLLGLYVPTLVYLLVSKPSVTQSLAIVTLLGMSLYVIRLMHSPIGFTFSDEFAHWRNVIDIQHSYRLFTDNPLLPVTSLYPGLASITSALSSLSGLDGFASGILIISTARLGLTVALFLMFVQVSGSARIAGIASILYMANPNYAFWLSQYAYESLALPLAIFVICILSAGSLRQRTKAWVPIVVMMVSAVVITHHMTSFALAGYLFVWAVVIYLELHAGFIKTFLQSFIRWYAGEYDFQTMKHHFYVFVRDSGQYLWLSLSGRYTRNSPLPVGLFTIAITILWMIFGGNVLLAYLAPHLFGGFSELIQMIAGESTARQLFTSAGQVAPLWERLAGFSSVIFILLLLPYGLFFMWRMYRKNALAMMFAVISVGYPITLMLRFTTSGQETANRASEFLFVGLSFILAVAVTRFMEEFRWPKVSGLLITVVVTVIFLGGTIVGSSFYARLPGSYLPAAGSRSIEPEGIAAATWANNQLGDSNHIIADRTNRLLMSTYGQQAPVTIYHDRINTALVLFALRLNEPEILLLNLGQIHYVVVDQRMADSLPYDGIYVERGEPDTFHHTTPFDLNAISKFNFMPHVSRVFDSGSIRIYDVSALVSDVTDLGER